MAQKLKLIRKKSKIHVVLPLEEPFPDWPIFKGVAVFNTLGQLWVDEAI